MKRVRTPCSARSGSSRSIVSLKISIRESTSGGGRSQFSVENAYTVSDSIPRSIAASTVRRSARVPSRCPASTGNPCLVAQRPLPSRMIATERGISDTSGVRGRPNRPRIRARRLSGLHLGYFGFLAVEQLVDLLRVLVGELLHPLFGAALVVL